MPKTKAQKKEILESLIDKLTRAKSAVFANFNGLKVKEVDELRKKCRDNKIDYLVAKKTLINLALKKTGLPGDAKKMIGEVALVFGYQDETESPRIIETFAKEHKALKSLAGIFEKQIIGAERVKALAELPSKPELYAKIVGSIKAPISGFVNVLAGNLRGLVQVLKAISEKK